METNSLKLKFTAFKCYDVENKVMYMVYSKGKRSRQKTKGNAHQKTKGKKILTWAVGIIDTEKEVVEEVHYYPTTFRHGGVDILNQIATCFADHEWPLDENTKQVVSVRIRNTETNKKEKCYVPLNEYLERRKLNKSEVLN